MSASANSPRRRPKLATVRTPKKRALLLAALAEGLPVRVAAQRAGMCRSAAFEWKSADPELAAEWAEAVEEGNEAYEAEARRRAVEGTQKPVYQGGELVGHVREYSDTLLIFLMKAREPKKYRENLALEHSGPDGGPLAVRVGGRLATREE